MKDDRVISRLLHSYTDCITIVDGELDYEETCWKMATRVMESMLKSQQASVFGTTFDDVQECFDHIVKKIPGLCEGILVYIEEKGL